MKKFITILIAFGIVLALAAVTVNAKTTNLKANPNGQVPEVSGDYALEGRSDMRVRVFVMDHRDARGDNNGKKPPKDDTTPTPEPDYTPTPTPGPDPVCSNPASSSVVGDTGWYLTQGNIYYSINESSAPSSVGASSFRNITTSGFSQWTDAIVPPPPASTGSSYLKPNPTPLGTTTLNKSRFDGQNIVSFGRTDRTTLGVTYVWYYTASGLVAEVDTILNQRVNWVVDACSESAYDANSIMVHEQGHWYGLDDHYTQEYENNTMFGSAPREETKKATIEQGDIAGLNLIYPY